MTDTSDDDASSHETQEPMRIYVADELGLIRTLELPAEKDLSSVKVQHVEGEPDKERSIQCLTTIEGPDRQLLCMGRKNGCIEVLDSTDFRICGLSASDDETTAAPVHLTAFESQNSGQQEILSVTEDGWIRIQKLSKRFISVLDSDRIRKPVKIKRRLSMSVARQITTADVWTDGSRLVFGGDGVDASICDLEAKQLLFVSKPPRNPYQLWRRNWISACCFLPGSSGNLLFGGNAEHQLFLYDVRASRRPVYTMEAWRDSRVTATCPENNGMDIWVANAMGFVDRFDLRKNYIRGSLKGQVAGSVRALELFERGRELCIASAGLDRFLRIHSTVSRSLKLKCYCKSPLTAIGILPWMETDSLTSVSDAIDDGQRQQPPFQVSRQQKRRLRE